MGLPRQISLPQTKVIYLAKTKEQQLYTKNEMHNVKKKKNRTHRKLRKLAFEKHRKQCSLLDFTVYNTPMVLVYCCKKE